MLITLRAAAKKQRPPAIVTEERGASYSRNDWWSLAGVFFFSLQMPFSSLVAFKGEIKINVMAFGRPSDDFHRISFWDVVILLVSSACHLKFATRSRPELEFHYSNSLKGNKFVFDREVPAGRVSLAIERCIERVTRKPLAATWENEFFTLSKWNFLSEMNSFAFGARCWLQELTNFYDVKAWKSSEVEGKMNSP